MPDQILKDIAKDLKVLRDKMEKIEQGLDDLSNDFHDLRPEYLEKLKKIDKGKFISRGDFEKELEED